MYNKCVSISWMIGPLFYKIIHEFGYIWYWYHMSNQNICSSVCFADHQQWQFISIDKPISQPHTQTIIGKHQSWSNLVHVEIMCFLMTMYMYHIFYLYTIKHMTFVNLNKSVRKLVFFHLSKMLLLFYCCSISVHPQRVLQLSWRERNIDAIDRISC